MSVDSEDGISDGISRRMYIESKYSISAGDIDDCNGGFREGPKHMDVMMAKK